MSNVFRDTVVPDAMVLKYDRAGPRYTSYPTVPHWSDEFGIHDHRAVLEQIQAQGLSLYFHLPFCKQRCRFCGCSVVVTSRRRTASAYVDALIREMKLVIAANEKLARIPVKQIHWGGGTPTYLLDADTRRLAESIQEHFDVAPDAEISIEVDPRMTDRDQLELLRDLGFNRISVGVQDVEPNVQSAIGRIQPLEMVQEVRSSARDLGVTSVNFDLIYGLPLQTRASLRTSLKTILDLRPDRLSLFSYAHVPWIKKHQCAIPEDSFPSSTEKFRMFQDSVVTLIDHGYEFIGLDHFALPDDELTEERREGKLQRNFQGYSTRGDLSLLGFGATAISSLGNSYVQTCSKLAEYYRAINHGRLATHRGLILDEDDMLRRRVISDFMCHSRLNIEDIQSLCDEPFSERFSTELKQLEEMRDDGLVEIDAREIRVTPMGRLFIRNICMVFDAHLGSEAAQIYSRTV